jgi:endonuclease YncB( thermonuclease family)
MYLLNITTDVVSSPRGEFWVRLIVVLFLSMIVPAAAFETRGVPQIVDADTVYIGHTKIRLQGVDAPEMDQICMDGAGKRWECGIAARSSLEKHSAGRPWRCVTSREDRFGRDLATCFIDNESVNSWLVRQGWALAFRRYSKTYVADEEKAQTTVNGLWRGAFVAPWDWRHRSRTTTILGAVSVPIDAQRTIIGPTSGGEPPSSTCTIKGNLRASPTCIYHVPGGQFYDRLSMNDIRSRRWFCSEAEAIAAGCRRAKQ